MAYDFYLDGVLMPIAPSKLTTSIKNKNKTIDLINGSEINILKDAGLTEIEVDFSIPIQKYPFAKYPNGVFLEAKYYLDLFERLKNSKKPFQFVVSRVNTSTGKAYFYTDYKVSLEDYTNTEDANDGDDVTVTVKMKHYKEYSTKVYKPTTDNNKNEVEASKPRPDGDNKPKGKTYTVKGGDSLYDICKSQLGNGSLYPKIYELNKAMMDAKNKKENESRKYTIYAGQVLRLE